MKRHFVRMHGLKPKKPILKPGEKLYECVLCDHSTKWQSAYRRHMRSMHAIVKLRSLSRKEKTLSMRFLRIRTVQHQRIGASHSLQTSSTVCAFKQYQETDAKA